MWRPNSSHETNEGFAQYELEGRVQLVRIVVCWDESPLNMIIKPPPSNGNFTQIPNEIIRFGALEQFGCQLRRAAATGP